MGRIGKRYTATLVGALLPTAVWWFVTLDVMSPFQGSGERLVWVGLTAYVGLSTWFLAYRD